MKFTSVAAIAFAVIGAEAVKISRPYGQCLTLCYEHDGMWYGYCMENCMRTY